MLHKRIYLDHAAATPLDSRVFSVMKPFLISEHGNPSALYRSGVVARQAVESARRQVADVLHTNPDMIVFTSGGTEGNNMAILGAVRQLKNHSARKARPHIITTTIEHSSVLEPIRQLEKEGCAVTYLPVDSNGLITVEQIKKALKKNTVLISIGYVNNEIGTIQPIAEIGKMLLQYRKQNPKQTVLFHTDACQAVNYCDLSVERLHVDLMTVNGSKIYGPKGVGALFVRRGVMLESIMYGGGQEKGMRSGTENVAAIVGFGKALELVEKMKEKEAKRLRQIQISFLSQLQKQSIGILNGPQCTDERLPNNLNIHIPNIEAETLILYLDAAGIECSAGSACSTDSYGSSHVLRAIGLSEKQAKECIRLTMGRGTKKEDSVFVIKQLSRTLRLLNTM